MAIRLAIGLGNSDEKYKNTYHNVGHLFIDQTNLLIAKKKTGGVYMNESGKFVQKEMGQNIAPAELLVIHDDSDIPLGSFKLSFSRGAGGHKGVIDCIDKLGTKNFWRLRIGIRNPHEATREKAEKFVLREISKNDLEILRDVFEKAKAAIEKIT